MNAMHHPDSNIWSIRLFTHVDLLQMMPDFFPSLPTTCCRTCHSAAQCALGGHHHHRNHQQHHHHLHHHHRHHPRHCHRRHVRQQGGHRVALEKELKGNCGSSGRICTRITLYFCILYACILFVFVFVFCIYACEELCMLLVTNLLLQLWQFGR